MNNQHKHKNRKRTRKKRNVGIIISCSQPFAQSKIIFKSPFTCTCFNFLFQSLIQIISLLYYFLLVSFRIENVAYKLNSVCVYATSCVVVIRVYFNLKLNIFFAFILFCFILRDVCEHGTRNIFICH